MSADLQAIGFVPAFARQVTADELAEERIARVVAVQRSQITLSDGERDWSIAPGPRWRDVAAAERPTVGDWIVLDTVDGGVQRVLERRSLFKRVAAGDRSEVQAIAANVDIAFVVTSCNEEFKESRLERYLALAVEAGVIPVVVLTKTDLSDDPDEYLRRARQVQAGLAVESINALDAATYDGLRAWIDAGSTVALVGSSGVGKSTIVNTLAGASVAATGSIRDADQKGRHTTTHRALHRIPGGGLLIDVPGMREIRIADVSEALGSVFADVEALAAGCRFADCRHEAEPGCAVRAAVDSGALPARRLSSYAKLLREDAHNSASLSERRAKDRRLSRIVRQALDVKRGEH